STNQPLSMQLVELFQPNKLHYIHSTHSNIALLEKKNDILENENEILKSENEILKTQFAAIKGELEAYKNPRTCSLRTALKYPISRTFKSEIPKATLDQQESELQEGRQKEEKARQKESRGAAKGRKGK
ncbi:3664_t:CDS:2, partial [Racocetra fulgida]